MDETEKHIIRLCREGNRKAQLRLYENHYRRIYNSCYRILGNSPDAEDAMQESFLKIFTHLGNYKFHIPFEAWISRIAINTSIDKLREKKVEFQEIDEEMTEIDYSKETDDWEFLNNQVERIKINLNSLPINYRLILQLHLLEGFDFEEIAEILTIKPGTVRVRYLRGKEKLKELLVNENSVIT